MPTVSRRMVRPRAIEKEVIMLPGSFTTAGGMVDAATITGEGIASITNPGNGAYVVTFQDTYVRGLSSSASSDDLLHIVLSRVPTTTTLTIQSTDFTGTGVDVADGTVVHFVAYMKNSTV